MSLSSKSKKDQQQVLPMLLFMLQNQKHKQIIKSMLSSSMSLKLLKQYGHQQPTLTKLEEFKINQQIQHFTVDDVRFIHNQAQLIQIKGSTENRVKRFQNIFLQQAILRKLKLGEKVQGPVSYSRKNLWLQFTDIFACTNLYEGLIDLDLPQQTQAMLDKDIKRTYYHSDDVDSSQQKQVKTAILRQDIKQGLSRFALYNPYILYCQGINEVFGFLHEEGFSPKQSFFIMKRLTEIILPSDYYSSLLGITTLLKILWEMVAVKMPKIHQKLSFLIRELDINGSYLCVFSHFIQWFVCLFCNSSLNREIRRTIFDYLLLEGITVFFKASLAILDYLSKTILKVNSFEQYILCIEKEIIEYSDTAHLVSSMNKQFISTHILMLYAQYIAPPKQSSNQKIFPYLKKCNRKWNFCQEQLDRNMQEQHKYDFFVFKPKQTLKIIPDYIERLNSFYFDKKKHAKKVDFLKIGRISHICDRHSSETCTEDSLSGDSVSKTGTGKIQLQHGQFRAPSTHHSPTPKKPARTTPDPNTYSIRVKNPSKQQPSSFTPNKRPNEQSESQKALSFKQQQAIFTNTFFQEQLQQQQEPNFNDVQQNDRNFLVPETYHRKQTLEYRQQIKKRLNEQTGKKSLQKSESMMFMKMMVQNESYSNLFNLLQNQDMNRMFDLDEQLESDHGSNY